MYQKYLRLLSVLLLFLVFWFLFDNWNDIIPVFYEINIYWAIIGFICYFVSYIFRGIRLRILTGLKNNFVNGPLYFSFLHGFFSYLLPLRAGDASLPVLLKSTGKINFNESIGVLVKSRFMDFTMMGMFSVLGAFLGARMISQTVHALWLSGGLLLTISFFIIQKLGRAGNYILKKMNKYKFDISSPFSSNYKEFLITFFIWLGVYSSQYCMIKSIGLDLKLSEVIFISAIQLPLQMLPVQGLANSGNHEGGWVSALVLMGFTTQESIKYAIVSHGVLIIYVALLGLIAMIAGSQKIKLKIYI